jgi:protein-S-isoprenylcysteine O-methyltransferase Ste14
LVAVTRPWPASPAAVEKFREFDMHHPVGLAVVVLWVGWGLSWLAAALWSNRTEKTPGLAAHLRYRVPMLLGAVVLFYPAHSYEGPLRLWRTGWLAAWGCVLLIALGMTFAWWARIHLGRLWSGNITRKADHHVVDTGPYAIVRHPIYTGLLLSLFATAAVKGVAWGFAGVLLTAFGIWLKATAEEAWLRQELGEGAYDNYRRQVPMLLPFGPKGG